MLATTSGQGKLATRRKISVLPFGLLDTLQPPKSRRRGSAGRFGRYAACVFHFMFEGLRLTTTCFALGQYTDKETVPGIKGGVDGDYFQGTEEELRALCY